jgi:GxxExxY protein
MQLHENEISGEVIKICFDIHSNLGPGLLESVYEEILCFELHQKGFGVERQKGVAVFWKDIKMDLGFRPDVIVENKVIVELKSVDLIPKSYPKILLTYLRLTNIKLGLLINFNEALFKDGITRVVNNL